MEYVVVSVKRKDVLVNNMRNGSTMIGSQILCCGI